MIMKLLNLSLIAAAVLAASPALANDTMTQTQSSLQRVPHVFFQTQIEENSMNDRLNRRSGLRPASGQTGSSHLSHTIEPDLQTHHILQDVQARLRAPSLDEIQAGAIMQFGQTGSAIQEVTRLMRELDYEVEDSTYFNRELAWQIGRFQLENQLADKNSPYLGQIGPSTLSALQEQAQFGRYDVELGQKLVRYARNHAVGTKWRCYYYVANAIHAVTEPFLEGMHAYMAADHLARSEYFKEIDVPRKELDQLPAGAVVVWGKGSSRSGHISIADGQGKEISDHITSQMMRHYGGDRHRVFLPVSPNS